MGRQPPFLARRQSLSGTAQPLPILCRLGTRTDVQLAMDVLHIVGNGVPAQALLHANFEQGVALGHAQQQFAFPARQVDVKDSVDVVGLRPGLRPQLGHHAKPIMFY